MKLRLIQEARRKYGDKALAFFGCRQEGLGGDICEQDILVYPSSEPGRILKVGGKIYEFVPISDPTIVILEKKTIKPFYDPLMLLHSALSGNEELARREIIIREVESGIRDLILSLYFDYDPIFIARAGLRLARVHLLLKGVTPRPTHMFKQLREHAPALLYRLKEIWGLDVASIERLDPSPMKRMVPETTYEITHKKVQKLTDLQEYIAAKLLLLNLVLDVRVKEDKNPFFSLKLVPRQDDPREWVHALRDRFRDALRSLKS